VDEFDLCPKGVPRISSRNVDAWDIYQLLSTQSVEPNTGLIRYDATLIGSLFKLFGIGEERAVRLSGKILFMVDVANSLRLKKIKRRREEQSSRQGVPDESDNVP